MANKTIPNKNDDLLTKNDTSNQPTSQNSSTPMPVVDTTPVPPSNTVQTQTPRIIPTGISQNNSSTSAEANSVKQINEVSSFDTPGIATALTVKNNTVFLADKDAGLRIIDVTNPSNPIEVGFYDTSGRAEDVAIVNSIAYIADANQGLQLVDVSNIKNPKLMGTGFVIADDAEGVVVVENKAFVRFLNSLEIIDVSNPYSLKSLATIGYYQGITSGSIEAIAIKDNILFACCRSVKSGGGYELKLFDIVDPVNPKSVVSYSLSTGSPENIVISGNHAFVSYRENGIDIFDVENIQDIRLLGHSGIWTQEVAVSGNNVITASGFSVDLLDVGDLNNPKFSQELGINSNSDTGNSYDKGHAIDIATSGNYAYIANSLGGLKVISLADDTPVDNITSVTIENNTLPSISSVVKPTTLSDVITSFVFLSASDMTYKVSNSSSKIFGFNGNQTLSFDSDVFNVLLDANIEHLVFKGSISSYLFKQSGVNLNIYDGNSALVASIGLQDDDNGTELSFAEGTFNAKFAPTASVLNLTIGNNVVNNEIPEIISTIGISSSIQ